MTGHIPRYANAYLSSRSTRDTRLHASARPKIRVKGKAGVTGGYVDPASCPASGKGRKRTPRKAHTAYNPAPGTVFGAWHRTR